MATPQQYTAGFNAAWRLIQAKINSLGPFEQPMARQALKADLVQEITNAAVDAALAVATTTASKTEAAKAKT
jgi:hypothetical protein